MATKKNPRMNQLGNISSIPYPIPATVKALGEPEEIFPPSTQRSSLGTLIGSLLAITAFLLFAIGAMLLYCAVHPFGTNPPPAAVCWGAGAGLTLLGFAALFGSYYYLSSKGDNKQAYLIFPHCLIEILPAQHRFIPWESIREKVATSKAAVAALRTFRFSTGTGKDVAFDSSLPRHEDLAELLRTRGGKPATPHIPAEPLALDSMDSVILANPKLLMQPMNDLVQTLTQAAPPHCSVRHLTADVRTENGRSSILFTHGSPLEPTAYSTLVPDNIAHASFKVIDPMLRLDAAFPGFEILLRKTSPENWNVKFHRLDQPGPEFSDLPRCPLRLCGYGLSLVPLAGTTFRWTRNVNPPGVIAASGSGPLGPFKQVQVILDDAGTRFALGQGVTKAQEVLEIGEGPEVRQWIIEKPLFRAVWPNGLDLRSPLASRTHFDLVGPQPDGTLVFVQGPSSADERILDTMAVAGQQEVARGKTSAGHPWIELRYDSQGTLWRQRHYARRLAPQTSFVVTAQCPQAAAEKIFPAADELVDSLAPPLHS